MTKEELVAQFQEEDDRTLERGLRGLLASFEGRSVRFRLITESGLWDTSPYRSDPQAAAYETGRQAYALEWLYHLNKVEATAWPELQKEMLLLAESRDKQLKEADDE